jgi:hypothetical protein
MQELESAAQRQTIQSSVRCATRADEWLFCSPSARKTAIIALYEEFVLIADALYAEHLKT